ncbi:glycosyltransferase family A protein [Yeosuana marina]|uniref:glycosyltransferase family A protein n=1 Tax=Yeosuana marina TaxID=1565536 RepID=UPI0030EB3E1E|tara:strand:- start:326 stop:1336 length:1011 start_codon:yes stop_codon:yes gene_type:complete
MRIGRNPNKNILHEKSKYLHQIVIPVYIPNHEDYFKDCFKILKLCLESLFNTVHKQTFITIVNNGSSKKVEDYLNDLKRHRKIHELIHSENIGKLNAILKGLAGNNIEFVTISDADVLFLPNWQRETVKVFKSIPQAGVVGIVPQFKMFVANCGNVIFDNFWNKKMKFIPVKNNEALVNFYDSIGWDRSYNKDYLKYNLGLEVAKDFYVLIGSGHFVATYKKEMFSEITSFIDFKLGGKSLEYLDKAPLKKGYWRLTTQDNYAYHMGNTFEDWMKITSSSAQEKHSLTPNFYTNKKTSSMAYFIKNKVIPKFMSNPFFYRLFLKFKGLPKNMIKGY